MADNRSIPEESAQPSGIKPFAEHGNFCLVHNSVFDRIMPRTPPNAFKVLMLVLRKTKGWGKEWDAIAYEQIREGTGIKTDTTIHTALEWLLERGLIVRSPGGHGEATAYALNRNFALNGATTKIGAEPTPKIVDTERQKEKDSSDSLRSSGEVGKTAASPERLLSQEIAKRFYDARKEAKVPMRKKDNEFGYHIGRAEEMLREMEPTDEELEQITEAYMRVYTFYGDRQADAFKALEDVRRQRMREARIAAEKAEKENRFSGPAPWEPINPHGAVDPELSAQASKDYEEHMRKLREDGLI